MLDIEKGRGAMKTGRAADIIATSENPPDNILTLKQVSFAMKNGQDIQIRQMMLMDDLNIRNSRRI